MITVEDAFERIVANTPALTTERCAIAQSSGRVLAAPLSARRTQPGADMSAMDGYAVRAEDLNGSNAILSVIGESSAGKPFEKKLKKAECIRIFTGATVPSGADQVIAQEDVDRASTTITTGIASDAGRHIRPAGTDFSERQIVLDTGTFLTPKTIGLAASAGYDHLMVHRPPKVTILSTGDELVPPSKETFQPFETVNSSAPQLKALLSDAGAQVTVIDGVADTIAALSEAIAKTKDQDILVTIGGASVGEKDLVQQALNAQGMELDFWKIAMRPGKPLIHGQLGTTQVIGLPGNPVSAFVCSLLFVRPLIDKMMGRPAPLPTGVPLPLATSMPENGLRQHYVRARLIGEPGQRHLDPAVSQDSSLLTVLAQSDGLIVRPPHAPKADAGTYVPFLPF